MITTTFTLVAATPQVLLTGQYVIRQLVFNSTGAGTASFYDASTTSLTQSNPAYSNLVRDCSYTRTVTSVRDLACNTADYEYAGISDAAQTVAPNAAYPLLVVDAIGNPAAGQASTDIRLLVTRGLMANSTVGGTVQVTYELSVPS